jgi:hypothetical protein
MGRSDIVCEGVIISDFTGFDGNSEFEFNNGQVWKQAEYKYAYHYAYRPEAVVIDRRDGFTLKVEGMDETAGVRRLR